MVDAVAALADNAVWMILEIHSRTPAPGSLNGFVMIPPPAPKPDAGKFRVSELDGVSSTLLLPLWSRATETRRDQPMLRDDAAVEIMKAIDFDFDRFERKSVASAEFCLRARIFDQFVQSHIRTCPDCTVVELGVGLDTRFDRVDTANSHWLELDLPEVMALRRKLVSGNDRRILVEGSLLADNWFSHVPAANRHNVLFVAEGLLYFFSKSEIKQVFLQLSGVFPGARVLFDAQSPLHLWYSNLRQPLADARLQFSLRRPEEVESWDSQFQLEKWVGFGDRPHYQGVMSRLSWLKRAIGAMHPLTRYLFQVIQVRFANEQTRDSP